MSLSTISMITTTGPVMGRVAKRNILHSSSQISRLTRIYHTSPKVESDSIRPLLSEMRSRIETTSNNIYEYTMDLAAGDDSKTSEKAIAPMTGYETKSNAQLIRSALSFGLCQIPWLVQHAETLLNGSRRILGDRIIDAIMRGTFYGQFCAGKDDKDIQPVVQALTDAGIGSILDFAAEDDGNSSESKEKRSFLKVKASAPKSKLEELSEVVLKENHPNVRVYEYMDEKECDNHVETFLKAIRDVAALPYPDGYAAVKVSALVNPKLLARLSRAIVETQNLFAKFDLDGDGFITKEEFEMGFHVFFRDDDEKMNEMLEQLEESDDGRIDYIAWSKLLRPEDLPQITAGCRDFGPLAHATPSEEEMEMTERMYDRMHILAKEAARVGTRLLVDAEQALYQPAIDSVVLDLQRVYNDPAVSDFPVVYNTYQSYLKDSGARLRDDVDRSRRMNFHFGAKIVRGAYMESERALAERLGYPSPIHDTIEDTHKNYDQNVRFLMEESVRRRSDPTNVEVMLASHNQGSIKKAMAAMEELGIDRQDTTVCFAQLYGMMDQITYDLGRQNYRAFKYLAYGDVKMVMPYLLRRARENSSIAGGAKAELSMIRTEFKRRLRLA